MMVYEQLFFLDPNGSRFCTVSIVWCVLGETYKICVKDCMHKL